MYEYIYFYLMGDMLFSLSSVMVLNFTISSSKKMVVKWMSNVNLNCVVFSGDSFEIVKDMIITTRNIPVDLGSDVRISIFASIVNKMSA